MASGLEQALLGDTRVEDLLDHAAGRHLVLGERAFVAARDGQVEREVVAPEEVLGEPRQLRVLVE